MTKHYFSIAVAKEVGVNAAVVFQNLAYWIKHNEEKNINYHDGQYWTFNSVEALRAVLPYMTTNQIRLSLQKLKEADFIITGNYNRMKYDKTLWYAVGEAGKNVINGDEEKDNSIFEKSQTDLSEDTDGSGKYQKPIPDINTYIKQKIDKEKIERVRRLCGIS